MKAQNLEAEWKSEHLQGTAVVCVSKQERKVLASYSASFCGIGQFSSIAIQMAQEAIIFWTKGFSF